MHPDLVRGRQGHAGAGGRQAEDKHGIRASNTAALALDQLTVDFDRMVGGGEGQGLLQAQAVFGYTRLTCDRGDVRDELDWLAPDERDRIEAFRFAPRRGDFLLGRWTAKRLLAAVLPGAGLAAIAIRAAAGRRPRGRPRRRAAAVRSR